MRCGWSKYQRGWINFKELNAFSCAWRTSDKNRIIFTFENVNNKRISTSINSINNDLKEWLFFGVSEVRKFLTPMFERNLLSIKVKVLYVLIIGVNDWFYQTSTLVGKILMISVKRCNATWPNKRVCECVSNEFLFIFSLLADFISLFWCTQ